MQPVREPIAVQVLQHALERAHCVALRHGETQISYVELALCSIQYAHYFESRCEKNTSIALCISEQSTLICSFLGARLCGHNVLVLNPEWPAAGLRQCLDELQPTVSISDADSIKISRELPQPSGDTIDTLLHWIKKADRDLNKAFYTGFTSGSEGKPKGFTRHENSWLHSFETDADSYYLNALDTVVCPGKLAHSLFLYASLRALSAGLTLEFLDGLAHSAQRKRLKKHASVVLFAVPAQLQSLVDSHQSLDNIRLVVSAGAKLQPGLRHGLSKQLINAEIMECYGSSELSYIALSQPSHKPPACSVGKPCDGVEIRVVDSNDKSLRTGQEGRLLIRSALQFMGYAEPKNTTSLRHLHRSDGYIDSGDTGYLDDKGFLYITGRSDRMMQIAGQSIFPEQIEAALLSHPSVKNAAVFPIHNTRRGQRAIVVIEPIEGEPLSRRDLMSHMAKSLSDAVIPRHFFYSKQWPRTVSEKTDVKQLMSQHRNQQLDALT